jgi:hypothetical protein
VTGLRVTLAVLGIVAIAAVAVVGRPQVLAILTVAGILAFVVSAGCLAADLLPLRRRHALCSGLSLADAVVLAIGGQLTPYLELAPAIALVLLQIAPGGSVTGMRRRAPDTAGP